MLKGSFKAVGMINNNKDSCAISPSHLAERGVALVEAEKLKYRIAT